MWVNIAWKACILHILPCMSAGKAEKIPELEVKKPLVLWGSGVFVCIYIWNTDRYLKNGEERILSVEFLFCSLFRYPVVSHFLNNFSLLDMSLYIACCMQSHRQRLEDNFDIQGCIVSFPNSPNHKSMGIFAFTSVLWKCFHAPPRISAVTENLTCQLA